jgi:hypothetical protein
MEFWYSDFRVQPQMEGYLGGQTSHCTGFGWKIAWAIRVFTLNQGFLACGFEFPSKTRDSDPGKTRFDLFQDFHSPEDLGIGHLWKKGVWSNARRGERFLLYNTPSQQNDEASPQEILKGKTVEMTSIGAVKPNSRGIHGLTNGFRRLSQHSPNLQSQGRISPEVCLRWPHILVATISVLTDLTVKSASFPALNCQRERFECARDQLCAILVFDPNRSRAFRAKFAQHC